MDIRTMQRIATSEDRIADLVVRVTELERAVEELRSVLRPAAINAVKPTLRARG